MFPFEDFGVLKTNMLAWKRSSGYRNKSHILFTHGMLCGAVVQNDLSSSSLLEMMSCIFHGNISPSL